MNNNYYRKLSKVIETNEFFDYVYNMVDYSFCSFNYHETTLYYITRNFIKEINLKYNSKESL